MLWAFLEAPFASPVSWNYTRRNVLGNRNTALRIFLHCIRIKPIHIGTWEGHDIYPTHVNIWPWFESRFPTTNKIRRCFRNEFRAAVLMALQVISTTTSARVVRSVLNSTQYLFTLRIETENVNVISRLPVCTLKWTIDVSQNSFTVVLNDVIKKSLCSERF